MSHKVNTQFEEHVEEEWEQYIDNICLDKGSRTANALEETCNTLEKKCNELGIKYE